MNDFGSSGILSLFFISIILLGTATISNELILKENDENIYNPEHFEEMLNDTLEEISTYFNIKQIYGKYYNHNNIYNIEKIIILLKPYFDINFDITDLNILLSNGEKTIVLKFNDEVGNVDQNDIFEHENWKSIYHGSYSILVISDKDDSIKEFNIINENTDMIFITLLISDYFGFEKGDTIKISIIPSIGNSQTFSLKAPLPTSKIVNLY
jgi:archaellin